MLQIEEIINLLILEVRFVRYLIDVSHVQPDK